MDRIERKNWVKIGVKFKDSRFIYRIKNKLKCLRLKFGLFLCGNSKYFIIDEIFGEDLGDLIYNIEEEDYREVLNIIRFFMFRRCKEDMKNDKDVLLYLKNEYNKGEDYLNNLYEGIIDKLLDSFGS